MNILTKKIIPKHSAISFAVFVFLLAITQFLAFQNYLLLKSKVNSGLYKELDKLDESIYSILNSAETAMSTLSYVVQQYPSEEHFDSISEVLLKSNPNLDALELVDSSGVIYAVYPLSGNESIIGYNILQDSLRNKEVLKAIKKKEAFYAGPFQLKQGGVAIVGRLPIFANDDTFIGLTAVLININTLIETLAEHQYETYFQFSKINPDTGIEEFFFPEQHKFKKNEAMSHYIEAGDWHIYAQNLESNELLSSLPFPILGLFLSFIGAYLVSILLKQPLKLEMLVQKKTTELFDHQKKYRDLLEHSSDAVLVISDDFTVSFVSNSFVNMFGYSEEQTMKQPFHFFVHTEDIEYVQLTLKETQKLSDSELNQVTFRIVTKANLTIWVEATFSNLFNQNGINGIVVNMHDVTERVHYLEELQKHNKQLKEIAWTQSHIVRAPLVRIMSLIHLINEIDPKEIKDSDLFEHIYASAVELDKIIYDITKKAERSDFNDSKNNF